MPRPLVKTTWFALNAAAGGYVFGKWRWALPQILASVFALSNLCGAVEPTAIPRLSQAPKLEDFAAMHPTGAAANMLRVSNFTQNFPSDGKPGTERSEAFLGYDHENVYVVFLCWDHAHGVRANLTRREPPITNHDNRPFDSDDYIEITLDTFQDQRHGFVFDVNPKGVQADALWTEGAGTDYSWDTLWYSRGQINTDGLSS